MLKPCVVCKDVFDTRDRSPFAITCSVRCGKARKRQIEKVRKRVRNTKTVQLRMANKLWYGKQEAI